jgi:transcriptional regulator with XRE-family HTH domain
MTGDDEDESGYVIKVGAWIRSIRRQQHLSLQDVEAASDHEFKASVLGAYERGERAISVPRLQRLARFYRVPVDQMLPQRRRTRPPFGQRERPGGRSDRPGRQPSRNPGPARHRTDRGARGRDAQAVRTHHPGAARRLQRPHAHHPPRRSANGRMHLRLPSGAGACPARQPSAPPRPIAFPAAGPRSLQPRPPKPQVVPPHRRSIRSARNARRWEPSPCSVRPVRRRRQTRDHRFWGAQTDARATPDRRFRNSWRCRWLASFCAPSLRAVGVRDTCRSGAPALAATDDAACCCKRGYRHLPDAPPIAQPSVIGDVLSGDGRAASRMEASEVVRCRAPTDAWLRLGSRAPGQRSQRGVPVGGSSFSDTARRAGTRSSPAGSAVRPRLHSGSEDKRLRNRTCSFQRAGGLVASFNGGKNGVQPPKTTGWTKSRYSSIKPSCIKVHGENQTVTVGIEHRSRLVPTLAQAGRPDQLNPVWAG